MSYGEKMTRLSPCGAGFTAELIKKYCPTQERVIDIGCGRGDTLSELSAVFPDARLYGAEPDRQNADASRKSCPKAEICEKPLEALGGTGKYDVILLECVFSLLKNPEEAAETLLKLVCDNGTLILSDICLPDGSESLRAPAGGALGSVYTARQIRDYICGAGFYEKAYIDRTGNVLEMAASMIMDGTLCENIDRDTFMALRRLRAGYGVWIFGKSASRTEKKRRACGLILAAGMSSRMGDFKPLMPVGGKSMLLRCVEMMENAGAEAVYVVTGKRSKDIREHLRGKNVHFVHNARYAETQMFDSVRLGLEALTGQCDRVLICPVDVPAVRAQTAKRVLEGGGEFVCPVFNGRRGHPVALDAGRIPDILAYEGAGGLGGAVKALGLAVTELETEDEAASLDADTPEDYRRINKLEADRQ